MVRARSAIVGLVGVGLVLLFQGCSSQAPQDDEGQAQDATTELRQARAYRGVLEVGLDGSADGDSSSCREVELVATKEEDGRATVTPPMTFAIPGTATNHQGNTSEVMFTFSNSTADGSAVTCTYDRSGTTYTFTSCSNGAAAGSLAAADTFDLHFSNANDAAKNPDDKHSVSLTLDEAPPCGAKDAGADVSGDAPKDAGADARADAPVDAVTDTPSDVSVEPMPDAPIDASVDVVADAPADVAVDTGTDAPTCNSSNCTPNNSCDVATCSGSTCTHTNATNGTSCTGTNLCNQTYTCQSGTCTGSNPVVCTASDSCHVAGTCAPSTGVCSNPTAPNGTACTGMNLCEQTYACQSGVCTGSNPVVCTASDQCHAVGTCNPGTGTCSNPAQPNGTTCNDNNACTQTDTCTSGVCTGSNPVVCTPEDQCHAAGICNPSTGVCSNPTDPDGTPCTTGNLCFASGACTSGTCVGTSPVTCTASDQCHVAGTCNPSSGVCSNPTEPDGTACNDGNACTQTDACSAGACTGSNPVICTKSDQCHAVGTCNPASGVCSNPDAVNGIPCNDGNLCDLVDTCQTGTCTSAAHVVCTPLDMCHTAGTCNPATGVCSNPAIPGCDSNPISTAGVFEPNASLMGKVVDTSGNPITSYTIQVFDAPMGSTPRSDVALNVAGDGSFRARLTSFPTSEAPRTPPHHEIVIISSPTTIQVEREAYLHPTDAEDLGIITVVALDPKVTMIGPAGGTATDSAGLVEVDIPAGALTATIPVVITPLPVRSWLPFPLPDGTATTYGVDLQPNGTQFAVPATVRVTNSLGLPTSLVIPVGFVDAANARWVHEAFATWDGTRFAYPVTHFSTGDVNPPNPKPKPKPKPKPPSPPPPPDPPSPPPPCDGSDCCGSTFTWDTGSLRESFSTPSYRRQGRDYRVTLDYDSRLTFGSASSSVSSSAYGAVPHTSVVVDPGGLLVTPAGISHPITDNITTGSGACATSALMTTRLDLQFPAGLTLTVSSMGATQTQTLPLPAPALDVELPTPVLLPLSSSSDIPTSHFERQLITVSNPALGACVGSGGPFGSEATTQAPVATSQDPGPVFTMERHAFVHHRHDSPFGIGWAVEQAARIYRDPSGDIAVLARGVGTDETFSPRATTTVLQYYGTLGATLAHDHSTGQTFLIDVNGNVSVVNPDGSLSALLSGIAFGSNPLAADVTYVGGVRHFVVALSARLVDVDASGTLRTLTTRSTPGDSIYTSPGVAALNGRAYYASGVSGDAVLYQFDLTVASPTPVALSLPSGGDIGLDPQSPLSGCSFTEPNGLAFAPSGGLYIADRRRNVVYEALPDTMGIVSGASSVIRVVGDGMAQFVAPLGYRYPGPRFSVEQPVLVSVADDGTLWVVSVYGAAAYDPLAQEARWLILDKTIPDSEQPFTLVTPNGAAMAAGPTSLFVFDESALIRLDVTVFSSELDPTRTVTFDGTGAATLLDTTAGLLEAYDAQGRLLQRSKRTGEPLFALSYVDPTSDRIAQITDPVGGATAFTYDGSGHLASIMDPAGRSTLVSVNGQGDLVQLQKPDGEVWAFTYAAHHLSSKTSPRLDTTNYSFATDGTLSTIQKPAGEVSTLSAAYSQPAGRDPTGKTLHAGTFVGAHGATHTYTVDFNGTLASDNYTASGVSYAVTQALAIQLGRHNDGYSDRANKMGRIAYSKNNGLILGNQNFFDAQGRFAGTDTGVGSSVISSSTFDANGFLSAYFEQPANDTFQITRDAAGHPTKIAELGFFGPPTGREIDFTWNAEGLPATRTEHGVTTMYAYDANGNVLSTIDTLGRTTAMTYDPAGNVATSNDGQTTTTFTYDAANRLVTSSDALSNTTTYGYALPSCGCSQDDLLTSIHTPDLPSGVAWTMQYGTEGRLSSVTNPDGFPESYLYQSTGELTQLTDRNGNITTTSYDQLGRVNSITDALTRAHARTYPVPSATGWTGPSLLAGSATGTAATTSLTGTLNAGDYQIGTNGYDFVSGFSRFEPQVSLYQDATFQLSYGLQWDLGPRLSDKEDRNALPISSPVAFGSPGQTGANFREQTSYDGNLATPLLSSQSSSDPVNIENSSFAYDTDYDLTGTSGFEPPDPWVAYTYGRDTGGRITSVARTFNQGIITGPAFGAVAGPGSTYAYYPNGYLQTRTDADGEHDYVYDTRGLVETITIPAEGVYTFGYDQLGRNTQLTFPDGHVRVQQYDQEGRITSRCYEYTGGLETRCYTASYDPVGNPVTMTDPAGTDTLTYDALNRLVQVSRSTGGIEDYAFNTLGALSTNAGAALNMQRPRLDGAGNADSAVPSLFNSLPVTLDAGGRITSFNGDTFVYDKRNQLHSVTEGGSTELYGFDAFMRRIARYTSSTVNELYVYEGDESITEPQLALAAGQIVSSAPVTTVSRTASTLTLADQLAPQNIVATLDASGGVVKSWLYDGVDHPLRVNLSGTIMYYEVDLAGNVRRLRDPLGNDLGGYRYTAFGEAYPADAGTPAPLISQPLQWKARWFSPLAGGIYDVRARQWAPALGAFLSVDGLEFHGNNTTLWGWPNQSPVRFRDPSGRDETYGECVFYDNIFLALCYTACVGAAAPTGEIAVAGCIAACSAAGAYILSNCPPPTPPSPGSCQ